MPAFRRILETGTLHQLGSTAGVFPGSVWPTFYSGTLPGEHGVYHHLQWDADAMQLRRVTEDWLYVEPFWYDLERRGLRVATIDVPMTFPSRLTRGAEIINWGSHDELGPFRAHPRHLATDIRARFGRHPMGSEIPVRKSTAQLEIIRRNLVAGALLKAELSCWMLAQASWDFFLIVFGETHRGGHLLWPEEAPPGSAIDDRLLDVYRAVDRGIGRLLEAGGGKDTTFIIFALHGMGRNDSQEHFMPKVMDRVNSGFLGDAAGSDTREAREPPSGQRSAMRILREHLPARLQNSVARAVPVAVRDLVVNRQITAGHEWDRTPGIALLADLNGYLRWNLRGREHRGMLEPQGDRLEDYVAWVRTCLAGLRTPEAEAPLVREVLLTRDHFPGKRTAALPDAIVTWTGQIPASRVISDNLGALTVEPATGRAGNHRSDGFCVIVENHNRREQRIAPPRHISELGRFAS
ncbi:MAG: alkaline phosphatase family protein, partial [Acidobacteria bacterium]|nr:alkaline phosphatase family protein [Acidobacteriota bacterium]